MSEPANEAERVFLAALDKATAGERIAFVEGACASQPELLRRLRQLLEAHEEPQGPLDAPPPGLGATVDLPRLPAGPGTVIGPYKLLQEIGEGGMGAVFMAEQTEPVRRKVALKIIKPGMDSRQVIARFEAERQALALMDHPNIAKVLDAGSTESGRPYFVMELVKGVPITCYCDERRLTPRERLELFVPVCQAVQHAHHKGVIHRDLKPSNVLVCTYDGRPAAKVIDFGVAKAAGPKLTERTLFTEFGQVVGTLEYMSPEQAELDQLDIDTRSDVYALGVLLYELLTGTTPLERKRLKESALLEVLRLIREEEPPTPSTRLSTTAELPTIAANRGLEPKKLSGLVRGELDWIVMKALEKDRNRRYETADALAMDLQRYLHDEPVLACPPSATYRFRKFARRNKGPMLAAALVFGVLVVGMIGTIGQAVRATRAEGKARIAQNQAESNLRRAREAVNDSFTRMSESTLLNHPTLEPLRKQLLQSAVRYYEEFVREHADDPELQAEMVAACFRITNMIYALGEEEDWLTPFEQGVAVMEGLMRTRPDLPALQSLQAGIFRPMATYFPTPKPVDTLRAFNKACALWEELVRAHPTVPGFKSDLACFHGVIGVVQMRQLRHAEAAHSLRKACDLAREATALSPVTPHHRVLLGMGLAMLQQELAELGSAREAEGAGREALEVIQKLAADFPDVPYYLELLAWTWDELGHGRQCLGQLDKEEAAWRQELAAYDKLAQAFPTIPRYRNLILQTQQHLTELLWSAGRRSEAAEVFRQMRDWTDRVNAEDGAGHDVRAWFLATCPDPQFHDARLAVELAKRAITLAPTGWYWVTLGAAHYRAGNWQDAVATLTKALELPEGSAWSFFFLAMAHAKLGHPDQARQCYDRAVQFMEKSRADHRELSRFRREAEQVLGINEPAK
jgi:serine/threonine protein kinase/tetratricopeptide (TPR) repeat protein